MLWFGISDTCVSPPPIRSLGCWLSSVPFGIPAIAAVNGVRTAPQSSGAGLDAAGDRRDRCPPSSVTTLTLFLQRPGQVPGLRLRVDNRPAIHAGGRSLFMGESSGRRQMLDRLLHRARTVQITGELAANAERHRWPGREEGRASARRRWHAPRARAAQPGRPWTDQTCRRSDGARVRGASG